MPRLVAAALTCLALTACGGQSTPPPQAAPTASGSAPTTATYSAELCSAAAQYQAAANTVASLDADQVGVDGVKKSLQDLNTAATNLMAAARAQFAPQVAELQTAIASLKGTIAGLSSEDSLSTNLGNIAASVAAVEEAAKPIVDSVRTGCPSVPQVRLPPPA